MCAGNNFSNCRLRSRWSDRDPRVNETGRVRPVAGSASSTFPLPTVVYSGTDGGLPLTMSKSRENLLHARVLMEKCHPLAHHPR